jgi:tRNA pseudouridine38-40 synthase
MPVYRLDLAYDGSGFRGYARQEGQRTVQGELESALITYLKGPVETSVAGRTDAGVHARAQVVSFRCDDPLDIGGLQRGVNGILGPEISVRSVASAPDGFSARFSATWRQYRYLIDTGPAPDPLTRGYVWHVARELDIEAMRSAASPFVGEHDFSSFCRSVEGKSNVRRLEELTLVEDDLLEFWVRANAFCHQMVRSIVGYLYDVGRGFSDGSRAGEVIAARDRSAVATVAPPHGLTLWAVGYE